MFRFDLRQAQGKFACSLALSHSCMTGVKQGSLAVRYRDIDFDINEVEPSKWRWVIYQKIASDPAIRDKTSYDTRDEALIACQRAIDDKFPQNKAPIGGRRT